MTSLFILQQLNATHVVCNVCCEKTLIRDRHENYAYKILKRQARTKSQSFQKIKKKEKISRRGQCDSTDLLPSGGLCWSASHCPWPTTASLCPAWQKHFLCPRSGTSAPSCTCPPSGICWLQVRGKKEVHRFQTEEKREQEVSVPKLTGRDSRNHTTGVWHVLLDAVTCRHTCTV